MTRKAITTSHAVVSCDVCGRTLLRGEHADVFLQYRPVGATDFSTIGDAVQVTSPSGFFEAHRAVPTAGTWRAVWFEPISKTAIYSREVDFAG